MTADRKTQILDVAEQLVQTVGYDSFSYADLSARLGIRKASIHHHFPRKADLGVALCERLEEHLRARCRVIAATSGSSLQKLMRFLACGEEMSARGETCPMAALQSDVEVLPEQVRERHAQLEGVELAFVESVLREGKRRGELTYPGKAADEAALVLSAFKGSLQYARVHGADVTRRVTRQLRRCLAC